MPPRPFPIPITIGTDLCHYPRFMKYVPPLPQKTGVSVLYSLFDKVFTPNEQREFWRKWGNFGGIREKEARREGVGRWLGGRWAAKEAIIKAHSSSQTALDPAKPPSASVTPRKLFMRDIEIRTSPTTKAPFGIILDQQPDTTKLPRAAEIFNEFREEQLKLLESVAGKAKVKILGKEGELDFGAVLTALNEKEEDREAEASALNGREIAKISDRKAVKGDIEREYEAIEGQIVQVSISHDGEYVVATALAPVLHSTGVTSPGFV